MSAGQHIDYELLAQDAMRGVVREVLRRVASDGLPGDHHFYIAFNMHAPGVSVSKRLREKYPEEMTIVLQHRFWDLLVSDEHFEVKLTFDAIPERLSIPFKAVKVFLDPSVQYGLQFGDADAGEGDLPTAKSDRRMSNGSSAALVEREAGDEAHASPAPRPAAERRRAPRKPRTERPADPNPHEEVGEPAATVAQPIEAKPAVRGAKPVAPAAEPAPQPEPAPAAPAAEADTKVVSLERFRNKTK